MRIFVSILFVFGWIFPKISFFGYNTGIQDIAAIILVASLLYKRRISVNGYSFMYLDVIFSFLLLCYGIWHMQFGDYEGLFIALRSFIYVISVLSLFTLSYLQLKKVMYYVIRLMALFLLISFFNIGLNFYSEGFNLVNFIYGAGEFRIRAPFEPEGAASSQIPIGYLLSLVFIILPYLNLKKYRLLFTLGIIGTTSRSAVLSLILVYFSNIKFKFNIKTFTALAFSCLLLLLVAIKTTTANDGEIDGSLVKRLELIIKPLNFFIENPVRLLTGSGLSSNSLYENTNSGFYESFPVNSLMQGGLFLFLSSMSVLFYRLKQSYKLNVFVLGFVILLANGLGGSNYFSIYAYPFMGLIFSYLNSKSFVKN